VIVWAEPRPLADPLDPYWDVLPIPFYPPDLPDIRWSYLTTYQRNYVFQQQREMLFPELAAP
jgi:hypothetical protein